MELIIIILGILIIAILEYGSTYILLCNESKLKTCNRFLKGVCKKQGKALSRVEFSVTVIELLIGIIAVEKYLMPVLSNISGDFWSKVLKYFLIFLVTVIATYITMVLGIYIPKHLAVEIKKDKLNKPIIYLYALISYICLPITFISNFLDTFIKEKINIREKEHSLEKIKEIANIEYYNGNINKLEKQVLSNLKEAFDFNVGMFCVKFENVVYVTQKYTFEEILDTINKNSMSRILYLNSKKNEVLGVLYAKDLLNNYKKIEDKKISIKKILRQPVISNMDEKAYTVFRRMLKNKVHISLVKDETNENYGIVTMEDIIENLLGQIKDEYDK